MTHPDGDAEAVVLVYLLHLAVPGAMHLRPLCAGYVDAPVCGPVIQSSGVDQLIHGKAPLHLALERRGGLVIGGGMGSRWPGGRIGSYVGQRRG